MKKVFLCFFVMCCLIACREQSTHSASTAEATAKIYHKLEGKTMGTTWHITYVGEKNFVHKKAIDSLLLRINAELSTYIDTSTISIFNQSEKGIALNVEQHSHFIRNYKTALQIYLETQGYFDPTVMPLVNYWGFGYAGRRKVEKADPEKVKALLELVGMQQVHLDKDSFLSKDKTDIQLDFSALAKGYAVDVICRYFEGLGMTDFFVEIGGEVKTKGKNPRGEWWTVGISRPQKEAAPQDFFLLLQLNNQALATSGNYRNVYTVDGVQYFHTIDPRSGFPKSDRLLSASVLAEDCMVADAYATAFMVMGLDKSRAFLQKKSTLSAVLIYDNRKGGLAYYATVGLEDYISLMD